MASEALSPKDHVVVTVVPAPGDIRGCYTSEVDPARPGPGGRLRERCIGSTVNLAVYQGTGISLGVILAVGCAIAGEGEGPGRAGFAFRVEPYLNGDDIPGGVNARYVPPICCPENTGTAPAHPIVAIVVVFGAIIVDINAVGGFEGKLKFTATGYRQAAGHRSRPCAIVILDPEGYGVGPCREG